MRKEFAINDALVNNLVSRFQEGDPCAFDGLFRAVESFVRKEARKAEVAHGIPAADFESRFFESMWLCAQSWDGRTNFMQRLVAVMDLKTIDVVRNYTCKKNKWVNYRALSLDRQVDPSEPNGGTFRDLIADDSAEILPRLIELELRGDAAWVMGQFYQTNARYATAVYAKLVDELEGDRLAQKLGFDWYDTNARQLVSRAIHSFRKYATEQLAVA